MDKEDIVSEAERSFLRPIGYAQAVFLLLLFASPFIWIWHDWAAAWKTGATGLLGVLLCKLVYSIAKTAIKEAVESVLGKQGKPHQKSRFAEKIEKLASERNSK